MYYARFQTAQSDEPGYAPFQSELIDLKAHGPTVSDAIDNLVEFARQTFYGHYAFPESDTEATLESRERLVFSVDGDPAVTFSVYVGVWDRVPVDDDDIEEAI